MKLKWPGLILAFWVSVQGIASPPSFPECGGTLVQFAPIARRYSQYLAVTRIPITQIAAMMERESLEAPGIGPPDRAWKPAHFRWVSRRWVGWRTLLDQSRAGTAASWDRDDPPRQRAEMLRAEQYPVSRVTLRAMEAGTADYAIAIFDLGILDEGWFEFISPRGQVPGETNAFPNFDTPHLQPGAVRVHAGVSLETANAGLEMFVRDCLAFVDFRPPGTALYPSASLERAMGRERRAQALERVASTTAALLPDPPTTDTFWRHLIGFAVHPDSDWKTELRRQIQAGRSNPARFGTVESRGDLYLELEEY